MFFISMNKQKTKMSLVSTRDFKKKITIQLGDMIQSAGIYHLIYLAYIRYPSFFIKIYCN